jgi:hypothetical protein
VIEPVPGDRVAFQYSGRRCVGVVVAVITAGRVKGRGLYALRRRARIQFEDDGHSWETHRDLDAINVTAVSEQPDLFTELDGKA